MIHKLTAQEYLRRYDNMTATEKRDVMARVGEWLKDRAPMLLKVAEQPETRLLNIMQVSRQWDDGMCGAWEEGVRLMTAFTMTADTWLPDRLYVKASRRCIRLVVDILQEQMSINGIDGLAALGKHDEPKDNGKPEESIVPTGQSATRRRGRPRKAQTATTSKPVAQPIPHPAPQPGPTEGPAIRSLSTGISKTAIPRPQHIDQYAHLLPETTQKHAAKYGQLMRDLGTARTNMRVLMDDPHSKDWERGQWARTAVKIDEQIAAIRKELDAEWHKIVDTGNVVIDELGVAHIIDPTTGKVADPKPKAKKNAKPKSQQQKKLSGEERGKRATYWQKWLRDARPAKTDEHRKQWEQNAHELIRLGGKLTASMIRAGEHYGAKIPKSRKKS